MAVAFAMVRHRRLGANSGANHLLGEMVEVFVFVFVFVCVFVSVCVCLCVYVSCTYVEISHSYAHIYGVYCFRGICIYGGYYVRGMYL